MTEEPAPAVRSETPEYAQLVQCVHGMYALQSLGIGVAMLMAWSIYGAVFVGWPALIAMVIYRRKLPAVLADPFLISHFEWLKNTFWTSVVWFGAFVLLYFIAVGTFFNGALILVGLFGTFRSGWGWLMFSHGKTLPRRSSKDPKR